MQQMWCNSCWMCQQIFLYGWSFEICWNWRRSGINHKAVDRINANWWIQLEKIQSNKKEVIDCLPAENVSQSKVTFNKDGGNIQRTLGTHWNITDDNFSSKIINSSPTKCRVLSAVSTIFDQTGLLASFTLKVKLLLQSMWRLKISWDDKLPPAQAKYWGKWLKNLFSVNQVYVPRCYNNLNKDVVAYKVNIFNDASELAYGVVKHTQNWY